jgi:hypothetical protein
MPIPTPEPGLIISYAYVWDHEAQTGQEEGRKDRPCVIALAAERQEDGETLVTVLPVTHRRPDDAAAAVEIPNAIKKHLGLDNERSWVTVSEGDQFVWPGYDLRKVRRKNCRFVEHEAVLPPLVPAQLQFHGSEPATAEAVPALHRRSSVRHLV